jgi:PAS domain S-box-containing protein
VEPPGRRSHHSAACDCGPKPTRKGDSQRKASDDLERRLSDLTAELNRAKAALEAETVARRQFDLANARLAAIVESSPDAILSETLSGIVTSWNKAAERIFGYTAAEMRGRSTAVLIPSDRTDELESLMERAKRGKAVKSFETQRLRKDGDRIEVSLTLLPSLDEAGNLAGFSAIFREITDQKCLEKVLRESENRLKAIMDNSPAMIVFKDTQGRYLDFNRRFAEAYKLSLEKTVGKTDAEVFPPNQAAAFRANDMKVLKAGVPIVLDEVAVHADGPHTRIIATFPLYDMEGNTNALGSIVTDITEWRRLESEVLRISDREQQRIAQDLHDGLGQHLTGIVHLAAVLQGHLAGRFLPEATDAARIVKLLDDAVAQTRTLARGLHPVQIGNSGLMSSLEQLAAMVRDLFKIDCRFECAQPVLVPDNIIATHLYRIVQEAINNAIKHGRAGQIRIQLVDASEQIILTVQNNGVALPTRRSAKEGIGLRIMQYRAEMMGGSLVIDSETRRGTTVTCTVDRRVALSEFTPSYEG